MGVSVSETKPDKTMATAIATANSRNTRPTMPPISSTGMNTAIRENVIETIVKPISRAPLSAASNGRIPPSMWRTMFSSMTMASSTTKPTDSVKASKVMLLIEKPNTYIAAQVPTSDTGTASADHQNDENDRDEKRLLHAPYRVADRHRAVHEHFHADRRRYRRAVLRQMLTYGIDDGDRIGVGLALDRQHDGAVIVEPACDLVVLDAVDDARDLVEVDRGSVAVGNDHLAILLRLGHG